MKRNAKNKENKKNSYGKEQVYDNICQKIEKKIMNPIVQKKYFSKILRQKNEC